MPGRAVRGSAAIVIMLLATAVTLSGCGTAGGPEEGHGESVAEQPGAGTGDARGGTGQLGDRQGGGTQGGKAGDPKVGEPARAVIHTGRITLEVKDITAAADEVIRIAENSGGYVGKDQRHAGNGTAESTVTLRIPARGFASAVSRLAKLGRELQREITAEDVSESIMDLDSKITTMRASVKRTRTLLNRAQSISDVSTVERELSSREAELATLEARRRALANRVEYSTITVRLVTRTPPPPPPGEATDIGFSAGLKAGWHTFTVTVRVLLLILGAVLPFLVALAVPVVGFLWLRRRWLSRRPAGR